MPYHPSQKILVFNLQQYIYIQGGVMHSGTFSGHAGDWFIVAGTGEGIDRTPSIMDLRRISDLRLPNCLADGEGASKNHQEPAIYYRLAANQGLVNAQIHYRIVLRMVSAFRGIIGKLRALLDLLQIRALHLPNSVLEIALQMVKVFQKIIRKLHNIFDLLLIRDTAVPNSITEIALPW
jgi:hypothetical protein